MNFFNAIELVSQGYKMKRLNSNIPTMYLQSTHIKQKEKPILTIPTVKISYLIKTSIIEDFGPNYLYIKEIDTRSKKVISVRCVPQIPQRGFDIIHITDWVIADEFKYRRRDLI